MNKRSLRPVAALLGAMLLGAMAPVHAEGVSLAVGGDAGFGSILEGLIGKRVGLRLSDGEELTGTVSEVGEGLVLIKELSGREFFDAAVDIDAIEALVVRNQ